MPVHTVQQGECLSTLADRYRVKDWRALHEHPNNKELAERRKNPNVLLPGDQVFIPEVEEKLVERPTGSMHRFVLERRKVKLHVALKSDEGEAYSGKRFVLVVGEERFEGTTSGDGDVIAEVPFSATRCTLEAWLRTDDDDPDLVEELLLGQLDPVEEVSGVQARLANLGFPCPVDGKLTAATERAIALFRRAHELAPSGDEVIDDALREKLVALHDGG